MSEVGTKKDLNKAKNDLPKDSAWLFPEYDFEVMNLEDYRGVIIERILERGSWEQTKWLFDSYGESSIAEWVKQHGFRLLSKRTFALWRLTLGVKDYQVPSWVVLAKDMEPW